MYHNRHLSLGNTVLLEPEWLVLADHFSCTLFFFNYGMSAKMRARRWVWQQRLPDMQI